MCSIRGLPAPGSEVNVLITSVNLNPSGLVELWVSVDDGRKHIYEQMKEEIQIPKRLFHGSEGKPQDLCLVCISDIWHRARIVSIQSETYNVFLIDQGQPHVATSEALAWAHSDDVLLPPEIESCILANVISPENTWPEGATTFLNCLPGEKFEGLVQHVLTDGRILVDIPFVSVYLCECGVMKNIPGDEFKCLVQKCLNLPVGEASEAYSLTQEENLNVHHQQHRHDQYFYPELVTGILENVIVTEVIDPQNIYCKLLIFSKAVKILSEQIHQHYEENSDFGEVQPQTRGDACAARDIKGRWHRSLLKQNIVTEDDAVEVLLVDEGRTELVPVRDIRPLHGTFLRMPVVTYHCSLDGLEGNGTGWTPAVNDHLKSLLLHETLVARFDHHNVPQDVYDVILYADNAACINSCFLGKERSAPSPETEHESNVQTEPVPLSLLSLIEEEKSIDVQNNVTVNGDDLQGHVNTTIDCVPTSATDDSQCLEHQDPLIHNSAPVPTGFPYELLNPCDNDTFNARTSINVNVSCIESPLKFWCQSADKGDPLRRLMEDLQNHYASAHPQPLVESVCVARNPDNGMWYRAKMLTNQHSPVVDVRFIDYGQTRTVPLHDVRPIDPVFLRLNAQAFQCCLFNLKNSSNPSSVTWTRAALAEFQKFVDLGANSETGLRCIVKSVTSNEEGVLLNVVDIETPTDSACRILTQKYEQTEAQVQSPSQAPLDTYNYSTYNIEVGGEEKVYVISAESVNHFYCHLARNSDVLHELAENIKQLIDHQQCTNHPVGLNSICFARYTDNQWHRGQIVEMSPKFKVHLVDYGETLSVNESDLLPVPSEACLARSAPVLAVPLGLFDVPEPVPPEVNQWFSDCATNSSLTISVESKGTKGKLLVELFDGSVNVNKEVRKMISKMTQHQINGSIQCKDQHVPNGPEQVTVPNEDCFMKDHMDVSVSKQYQSSRGICAGNEHNINSNLGTPRSEDAKTLDNGGQPTQDVSDSDITQLSLPPCPEGNVNICTYKWPAMSQKKAEEVYASCIVEPHYFWCQYNNTEDLNMVSLLAQETGQTQRDVMSPETLAVGSPCLALFSSDNQWYRAQVMEKKDSSLHVVFIDYGNEADVEIRNVKSLPQKLLQIVPQAFLCSLNGLDESKGSWDDQVYEDFYNLLVDKPLSMTMVLVEEHSGLKVPKYVVHIECEEVVVNNVVQKYWKPVATEHVTAESPEMENSLQDGQMDSNGQNPVSMAKANAFMYKKPKMSSNQTENVYASCIVEPKFFWCQYANTEDLGILTVNAQEAGRTQQDSMFPETLGIGSSCLALFSPDNQWFRAQVMERNESSLHVVFIDFGNEADVDIKDVRSLPQNLLEVVPQAFLCSLSGFDESKGFWDDQVYDDFYNLLVDKPLRVTVFNMEDHSELRIPQYVVQIECENVVVNNTMQKYWKEHVMAGTETSVQDGQTDTNLTDINVSMGKANAFMFKKPNVSKNQTEKVYPSCIVEPKFFWCQFANTEDLGIMSILAQEAGQAQQDTVFPETIDPGNPCLALFTSDNQWYRAQVMERNDSGLHVVFMDYGNEAQIDIKDVRSLPSSLLDMAPQAFLCSLRGFDESKGSWDDQVYEDFYNLLVDKPLSVTVSSMEDHSELKIPQFEVEVECEGVAVNSLMKKYWKELDTNDIEAACQCEPKTADV
ncbi:tudor domain-containing 6-like [Solea solea]|uniref:tudor domain-containing 6-like n=1 Tax=Solea solea TaxID=90069 RepID=UPI00272B0859|nr:tudor domain-containing 6-like [Solea solea]